MKAWWSSTRNVRRSIPSDSIRSVSRTLIRMWTPVRRKKTRQNNNIERDRDGALAACRPIAKGFHHQGVEPQFRKRFTGPCIVVGASGEAVATQAVWQRRQHRALTEPLGPFLKVLRQKQISPDRHDSRRRRGDQNRAG